MDIKAATPTSLPLQTINSSSSVIGIGPGQSLQQRSSTDSYSNDDYIKHGGSLHIPNSNQSTHQTMSKQQVTSNVTLPHSNPHLSRFNNPRGGSMYSFSASPSPSAADQHLESVGTGRNNSISSQTPSAATTGGQPSRTISATFSGMGTHV